MKSYCCAWCHKLLTKGDAYRNVKTGRLACGWCRINPVLNLWSKPCKRVHTA